MKRSLEQIIWKQLVWQRPFSLESVWELLSHLAAHSPRGPLIWEVRSRNGDTRYLLGADQKYMTKIQEIFQTHGNIQFYDIPNQSCKLVSLARSVKITRPLLSLNTNVASSVTRSALAAMSGSKDTETVLQIVLGGSYAPTFPPSDLRIPDNWLQAVTGQAKQVSPETRRLVREKLDQHRFRALIRVGATGTCSQNKIISLTSALRTLESAGCHIFAQTEHPDKLNHVHIPWRYPLRLSIKELACCTLLPAGEEEFPASPGLHPKLLLPPVWYRSPQSRKEDRSFAYSMNTANHQKLSISPRDSLEHTVILGPTGSGKSTVLLRLILSDIQNGHSVLVLDPKADLVNDLLERIDESRVDDVVVLDPTDSCPVGFNPLKLGFKNPTLITDTIISVFKEIFADNWGIRSDDYFSAALLTLLETENSTLLWLPALLTDDAFRRKVVSRVKDKIALKPFWDNYEAMRENERRIETSSILNKMRQFLLRPGLRNVLGQANPKFPLNDLFEKRRIVLVPLNRGTIGAESAKLLGSLIVGITWTLALSRANLPAEKRHIIHLYMDELQDFLNLPTSLSDALAQARGLGLALTMAHQYRDQLSPEMRSGIDTNARNKIIFGLSAADAKSMAAMAPELEPLDFMSLPRYQIYTSFQQNRKNTGWVQGQTMPPPPAIRYATELRAASMARYGVPAEEIEEEYLAAITAKSSSPTEIPTDKAIGRRKKS